MRSGANSRFNLSGFMMGAGNGNMARGCVAGSRARPSRRQGSTGRRTRGPEHVDLRGQRRPQQPPQRHLRLAERCARTIITRFTGYHCDQGIFAGSYQNLVSYRDCTLYANSEQGLIISALHRAGASSRARRSPTRGCTSTSRAERPRPGDHPPPVAGRSGHPDRGLHLPGWSGPQVGIPEGATTPSCTTSSTAPSKATSCGSPTTPPDTLLTMSAADGTLLVRRATSPVSPGRRGTPA